MRDNACKHEDALGQPNRMKPKMVLNLGQRKNHIK